MGRSALAMVRAAALLALFCAACPPAVAAAAQASETAPALDIAPPATQAAVRPWYDAIKVNGFLSFYAETNFNSPQSRTSQYRVFDAPADSFEIPVAELVLQKPVSKPSDSGFRVDMTVGSTVPKAAAARGLFRDPATGEAEDFDLQQAYVSWIAPVGSGLRFDLGKHVTHMGMEVIEGYDGWNDNATRSFLFGFAIPFTHTGLRMGYTFCEQLSAQLFIVNGWDNVRDNNNAKSVGAQIAYTPSTAWTFFLNGIGGPEQDDDNGDSRNVVDLVALWKTTDRFTLGANADYGMEDHAALSGGKGTWSGVAGYARYNFTADFSLALRAEQFDDGDGARTLTAQTLREVTLTPEYKLDDSLRLRLDLRHDWSDESVFETDSGTSEQQTTALVSVIWAN